MGNNINNTTCFSTTLTKDKLGKDLLEACRENDFASVQRLVQRGAKGSERAPVLLVARDVISIVT